MSDRSAESSITGYSYQFLITILHILESNMESECIIEGIEDLDIINADDRYLNQYKYHAGKNITNSLISKPVILMLNHYLKCGGNNFKYKLFIHGNDRQYTLDINNLKEILTLKTGEGYKEEDLEDAYKDDEKLKLFIQLFSICVTDKFDILEEKVIHKISELMNLDEQTVRLSIYPLAYKKINDLARNNKECERKITGRKFIDILKQTNKIIDLVTLARIKEEKEFLNYFKRELRLLGIKKNNSDHIFVMPNDHNTVDLIIGLAQNFVYQGKNSDNRTPLFVVENIDGLKLKLISEIEKRNLEMFYNDGYEDIKFFIKKFKQSNTVELSASRKKINAISNFNFRLISKDTFIENQNEIRTILSNQVVFYLDNLIIRNISGVLNREFLIPNNVNKSLILQIFSGD
ncbi:hypothetical protein RI569_07325 [Streptococcus pneumoniae]|jgi:hypothetical protein|nr:hypothetical protein [Streptococcus pneumoniae]